MASPNADVQWSEFLSSDEIRDLTQARGLLAQRQMLEAARIPHQVVRNRILVSRAHVRQWLAGTLLPVSRGGVRLDRVK